MRGAEQTCVTSGFVNDSARAHCENQCRLLPACRHIRHFPTVTTKMQGMGSEQGFWTLLSEDERAALSDLGMRKDYPVGATLCLEGDPNTHVFILLRGWVKVLSATNEGHEIVLALRGEGDLVGETAGETTGRRNATIRAIDVV